jgi:hypothetical protein
MLKLRHGEATARSKLWKDHIKHVQQYWRRRSLVTIKDARDKLSNYNLDIETLHVSTLQRAIASVGSYSRAIPQQLGRRDSCGAQIGPLLSQRILKGNLC